MANGWGVGKWGTDKWGGLATYGVTVSDTNVATSIQVAATAYGEVAVLEDVVLFSVCNGTANFYVSEAETVALETGAIAAATLATAVGESAVLTSLDAASGTFPKSVVELVAVASDETATVDYTGLQVDELSAISTEEASTADYTGFQVDEAAVIVALENATASFGGEVTDTTQITALTWVRATFQGTRTEVLTIAEAEAARLRWELINDSQPTNWQNINNAAASNWQPVVT